MTQTFDIKTAIFSKKKKEMPKMGCTNSFCQLVSQLAIDFLTCVLIVCLFILYSYIAEKDKNESRVKPTLTTCHVLFGRRIFKIIWEHYKSKFSQDNYKRKLFLFFILVKIKDCCSLLAIECGGVKSWNL